MSNESSLTASINTMATNSSCPISHLPPEILDTILDLALPPSFLITPADSKSGSPPDGPWRRAMNLKLSLSLVNKTWCAASLRLLYENGFIRNVVKAEGLLDTLKSNTNFHSKDLSTLVKSISFKQRESSRRKLSKFVEIKSLCPSIKYIGLTMRRPSNDTADLIPRLFLTSLTMKVKTRSDFTPAAIMSTLRGAAETITHLHLHLVSFSGESIHGSDFSSSDTSDDHDGSDVDIENPSDLFHPGHIHFPNLHELELTFPPEYDEVVGLIEHWSLPQMRRVTVHTQEAYYFRSAWNFIRKHQDQIQYLHLDIPFLHTGIWLWHDIRECLKVFNSISHLVLRAIPDMKGLKSDSIEFLDVWQYIAPDPKSDATPSGSKDALRIRGGARTKQTARKSTGGKAPGKQLASKSAINFIPQPQPDVVSEPNVFPKIRQVRILDKTLRYLSHLPLDVPPDRVLYKEDEFNMKYDGIHIRHEVGRLVHVKDGGDEGEDCEEEED